MYSAQLRWRIGLCEAVRERSTGIERTLLAERRMGNKRSSAGWDYEVVRPTGLEPVAF